MNLKVSFCLPTHPTANNNTNSIVNLDKYVCIIQCHLDPACNNTSITNKMEIYKTHLRENNNSISIVNLYEYVCIIQYHLDPACNNTCITTKMEEYIKLQQQATPTALSTQMNMYVLYSITWIQPSTAPPTTTTTPVLQTK